MKIINSTDETKALGERLGGALRGGEMIELIGDVGTGKTTLTKGLATGLGIDEDIQSPSFTISREYQARDGLELHHYDFYRLNEPGVVSYELAESIANPKVVTVVEWGDTVEEVLPVSRVAVKLNYEKDGEGREVALEIPDELAYLKETMK